MRTYSLIILLKIISLSTVTCNCPSEENEGVIWPETPHGQMAYSNPPCINSNYEFQGRFCDEFWEKQPSCSTVQKRQNCPNGLVYSETLNICYTEIENTKFPPACPYKNVDIPFDDYKVLINKNVSYWMPIARNSTNGHGFLQWIEFSRRYKTDFTKRYGVNDYKIVGKDCVVYFNSSFMSAVACDEEHNAICAYKTLDSIDNAFCDFDNYFCRRSDYDPKSSCLCLGSGEKAEILQSYQNIIFKNPDKCAIGLEKRDGKFIWINSKIEINYTNWDKDTIFDDSHRYGAISSTGWHLLTKYERSLLDCVVFEKNPKEINPSLKLTCNSCDNLNGYLTLEVASRDGIKRDDLGELILACFSDATQLNLVYKYPTLDENASKNFKFSPFKTGPGRYWCEGVKHDLTVVTSNTIFFRPKEFEFEFVGIFEIPYSKGMNPLTSSFLDFLNTVFILRFKEKDKENTYVPRITRIIDVDETSNVIDVNIHFTAKRKEYERDLFTEFDLLKKITFESFQDLENLKIDLVSFKSVEHCSGETTNDNGKTLTWPDTDANSYATSKEYCFVNCARYRRFCNEDFEGGAQWDEVEDCHPLDSSAITESLQGILDEPPEAAVLELMNFLQNYNNFLAVDVYLVGEILETLSEIEQKDLEEILNSLLEISPVILKESREVTNATNKIADVIIQLDWLNPMFDENNEKEHHVSLKQFNSQNPSDFGGFINKGCGIGCVEYCYGFTEDPLVAALRRGDLIMGIILSMNFYETNFKDARMVVFWKSSFFMDPEEYKGAVYGVFLPDYDKYPAPIHTLEKAKEFDTSVCGSWNFLQRSFSFAEKAVIEKGESYGFFYSHCEITHGGYLAHFGDLDDLPTTPSTRTTESSLEDTSESTITTSKEITTDDDPTTPSLTSSSTTPSTTSSSEPTTPNNDENTTNDDPITPSLTSSSTTPSSNSSSEDTSEPTTPSNDENTTNDDPTTPKENDEDDHHAKTVTESLFCLLISNESSPAITEKLLKITDRHAEFGVEDLYYVGQILKKVNKDPQVSLQAVSEIITNLHEISRKTLHASQKHTNATDTILHYVDAIIQNHEYTGHTEVVSSGLMIVVSDLLETNITGLTLQSFNSSLRMTPVFGDDDEEVLANDGLDNVILLSSELKNQLNDYSRIAFTVFTDDALFNEQSSKTPRASIVFGVILPTVLQQSGPIKVIYNLETSGPKQCVHWNYDVTKLINGRWFQDQIAQTNGFWTECEFWHTTHFALLLTSENNYQNEVLDIITTVNCVLSLAGLFAILLTAVLFRRWRTNTSNQILLNFDFALSLQIVAFYLSSLLHGQMKDHEFWCTVIGVVLHYSIISEFCWMFTIAILQFKRFVEVLGGPPKYVLVKACICGWILPVLPVACVFFLDESNYVSGKAGLCYPSGLGLYLGVWLPLAIIVAINSVIFSYIICNVCKKKTDCVGKGGSGVLVEWKLAVLLYFMLGLSWIFGFLCELGFGSVFLFLFCITATLQGFVMFVFFIVFNKNTRRLYYNSIKRICTREVY